MEFFGILLDEILLHQMPGLFIIKDVHSNYVATNLNVARAVGFQSIENIVGITDHDLKCKASSCAEEFIKQDQVCMQQGSIDTLDIHHYASGVTIWQGTKSSLKDTKRNVIGSIYNGCELKHHFLTELAVGLSQNDKKYINQIKKNQDITYYINNFQQFDLTNKEFEVLFFLIRGLSIKEISRLFNRSSRTVETHVENIKGKLNMSTVNALVDYAVAHQLFNIIPKTLLNKEITLILNK